MWQASKLLEAARLCNRLCTSRSWALQRSCAACAAWRPSTQAPGRGQLSGRARPVPGRVAVALLAALLPMRQGTLKSYVAAHGDALDLEGLEALLRRVGLGRGNARRGMLAPATRARPGLPSYAPSLRLFRRSRWLALKLAGAPRRGHGLLMVLGGGLHHNGCKATLPYEKDSCVLVPLLLLNCWSLAACHLGMTDLRPLAQPLSCSGQRTCAP